MMWHAGLLIWIEVALADLLKLNFPKQTVEESFHERKHIASIFFRDALHPLNVNFVFNAVNLR